MITVQSAAVPLLSSRCRSLNATRSYLTFYRRSGFNIYSSGSVQGSSSVSVPQFTLNLNRITKPGHMPLFTVQPLEVSVGHRVFTGKTQSAFSLMSHRRFSFHPSFLPTCPPRHLRSGSSLLSSIHPRHLLRSQSLSLVSPC